MSAELDTYGADSRPAVIHAGNVSPWWGEGTNCDGMSFDEAIDEVFDWQVEKRPFRLAQTVTTEMPGLGEIQTVEHFDAPGMYGIVRTDRQGAESVLGMAKGRYTVVQNREGFLPLQPLIDEGILTLLTAGVLKGGQDVWMQGRWNLDAMDPLVREVYADDIQATVLFSNNHAGRRKFMGQNASTVVVCANTMAAALSQYGSRQHDFGIRHTASAPERIIEASQELLAVGMAANRESAEQYRALKQTLLDARQVEEFLNTIAKIPSPPKDAPRRETSIAQATERREELDRLFRGGAIGTNGQPTAWNMLMAVTEAIDHNETVFKSRGGERLNSLTFGALAKTKSDATRALLAYANVPR